MGAGLFNSDGGGECEASGVLLGLGLGSLGRLIPKEASTAMTAAVPSSTKPLRADVSVLLGTALAMASFLAASS
jgi:hypothetical protein